MGSTDSFKPKDDRPFLLNWMAANIVGLPILLGPYSVGVVLLTGTAILSDGGSIRLFWHVSMFMILALCGAVMGHTSGTCNHSRSKHEFHKPESGLEQLL